MKKVAHLFIAILSSLAATAQSDTLLIRKSATNPLFNRQTTLKQDVVNPGQGTDLKIELASIERDNSNFAIGLAGIYTIKFYIINNGVKPVDLTNLGIQSYMKLATNGFVSPEGGYGLTPALLSQTSRSSILNAGQRYLGSIKHFGFNPAEAANVYFIKIDHTNAIAESNENNNTLSIPIGNNLEWSVTPLPDLTFQVVSVVPVTGGGYLNARWEAYLINTGAGDIPVDIIRKVLPGLQVYPLGSPSVNLYNEKFPLEQRVVGGQVYPGYYQSMLPLKPGGKINISGASHINGLSSGTTVVFHFTIDQMPGTTIINEASTNNNIVDFLYKVL